MKTEPRPEVRARRFEPWTVAGTALLALGFAGMVLGIYEIGGLFALGLGFGLVWGGMVVTFAGERRRQEREDERFLWVVSGDPPG
ncbi:MAG TPA: hypothetical protein VIE12_06580 [Actinomycetota bacterium]